MHYSILSEYKRQVSSLSCEKVNFTKLNNLSILYGTVWYSHENELSFAMGLDWLQLQLQRQAYFAILNSKFILMEVEISFSLSYSILKTDSSKYLLKKIISAPAQQHWYLCSNIKLAY